MLACKPSLILATSLVLLAGCASSALDPVIDDRVDAAASRVEAAKTPASPRLSDPLLVSDTVWLGDKVMRLPQGRPLPAELENAKSIALRSDNPLTLNQLTAIISSQTRLPIRLTDGAGDIDSEQQAAGGNNNNAAQQGALPPGMIVSYEGPLSGLLNLIGGYYNVNWRFDGGTIVFSRYQTRTFVMDALPGSISMTPPEDTGGENSITPQLMASANIDIWDDIRRTITNIIGTGGTIDISQSSGTVVVSTTNDRMERVARFLEEENRRLSRQVAVSIEMYTVQIDDASAYGLDLTAALSSISGLPTIDISGPAAGLTDPGSITVSLVEPTEMAGTKGVAQALATLGKTTRLSQIPITTLNNRPATQSISLDTAYVSEVTSTSSGVDNVSTSISTDTITTGISVSVLPRIMSDGRILLQYALAQSDAPSIKNFTSGSSTVQLPQTQALAFSQQVMMKNGSTLVLAGFDQSNDANDSTGVGRPITWILGGSNRSQHTRQLVVVSITPREIRIARREAS